VHHRSTGIVQTAPVRRLVALAAITHPSETIAAGEIQKLIRYLAHRIRMPQPQGGRRRSWKQSTSAQYRSHILVRVADRIRAELLEIPRVSR
jgi:hypothetical protein